MHASTGSLSTTSYPVLTGRAVATANRMPASCIRHTASMECLVRYRSSKVGASCINVPSRSATTKRTGVSNPPRLSAWFMVSPYSCRSPYSGRSEVVALPNPDDDAVLIMVASSPPAHRYSGSRRRAIAIVVSGMVPPHWDSPIEQSNGYKIRPVSAWGAGRFQDDAVLISADIYRTELP